MKSTCAKLVRGTGLLAVVFFLLVPNCGCGQGFFNFNNYGAPTHIGSLDGPLAGTNIYAQALVGLTADHLVPVGPYTWRLPGGVVFGRTIIVPFAPPYSLVQVQLAAWDATLWGANFSAVPTDQLGFTDVVPVLLEVLGGPPGNRPYFTQSAIVPIPEPSALAFVLLVGSALALRGRLR